MKSALIVALVVFVAPSMDGQQTKPSETQIAINKLRGQMAEPLAELSALATSDKALETSNRAQIDTSAMLERLERKIKTEQQPRLKARFDALEEKRRQYVDSGCPAGGGMLPSAVADRCNQERIPLNEELATLTKEDEALKSQLATIAATRQGVTDTTLSNFQKQKANAARREDLDALKLAQESQLRKLYLTGIAEVVKRADLRGKAVKACEAISPLEESVCCLEVVNDERNPAQCNVPLIVRAFEKAGIFGTTIVK
jgi:hypothetical protein